MFADFGYWKGEWQSGSRPGPFIFLFVPAWFVALAVVGASVAIYFRIVRFGIRTLLMLTAIHGVSICLLRAYPTT